MPTTVRVLVALPNLAFGPLIQPAIPYLLWITLVAELALAS